MSSAPDAGGDRDRDPGGPKPTPSRREVMQAGGVTAGSLLAASIGAAPATAQEDDDSPETVSLWRERNEPLLQLAGGVIDTFLTDSTAHGEALWDQIFADAKEQEYITNAGIGSIENDAETLQRYLILDVANAFVEAVENGDDQQASEQAALDVLEDEVSNILVNLFNIWVVNWVAFLRRLNWVDGDDTGNIGISNIFQLDQWEYDANADELVRAARRKGQDGYPSGIDGDLVTLFNDYMTEVSDMDADPEQDKTGLSNLDDSAGNLQNRQGAEYTLPNGDTVRVPVVIESFTDADGNTRAHQFFPFEPGDADVAISESGTTTAYYENEGGSLLGLLEGDKDEFSTLNDGKDYVRVATEWRTFQRQGDDVQKVGDPKAVHVDMLAYLRAYHEIIDTYEDMSGQIATIADTLYEPVQNGEVSTAEIATGEALLNIGEDADDWQEAAAGYRAGGYSEGKEHVKIRTGGYEAQGTLFTTDRSGVSLPIGEWIDPATAPGQWHAALEILEEVNADVPERIVSEFSVVVVDDTDTAIEGADVTLDGATETTDAAGEALFSDVPQDYHEVTINDDGTETLYTVHVSEPDDLGDGETAGVSLTANGADNTADPDDLPSGLSDEIEAGDIVASRLMGPFKILEPSDQETLEFEESSLYEPDDTDSIIRTLTIAYDNEDESRNGETDPEWDVSLPGLPGLDDIESGIWTIVAGVAILAGAVLAIGKAANDQKPGP